LASFSFKKKRRQRQRRKNNKLTATFGTAPIYTKQEQVSGDTPLGHGEYYLVEGSKTDFMLGWWLDVEATEKALIEEAKRQYEVEPEVELIYAEATIVDLGLPGFFYDVHTKYIVRCKHPIAPAIIIAIAIAIAIIIVAVTLAVIMWHVTVSFLGGNLWAVLLVLIIVTALVFAYVSGKRKG
jgi:hypothetical protein